MVRFVLVAGSTHDEVVANRGSHLVVFQEADQADRLKTAQPHMQWGTLSGAGASGPITYVTLPYAEFADIVGQVLWVPGVGFPAHNFLTSTLSAEAMDRSWKVILTGLHDWTPCKPGVFRSRVKQAAASSIAGRAGLEVKATDFYAIPCFDTGAPPFDALAWASHLTFTPGVLANATDGTLAVWVDLCYYAEDRIPTQ